MTETTTKHPEGCMCGPCENIRILDKHTERMRDERKEHPDTGVLEGMPPGFTADTKDEKLGWHRPYKKDDGEPLSYQDFLKQQKPKYVRPRVRMFRFVNLVPTIREDKYGEGRHEYEFPIEDYVNKAFKIGTLRTAAGGLIAQIQVEVKNYGESGELFKRTQVLIREGDGARTTYWLRGYDVVNDAFEVYDKATAYLKGREGQQ